MKRVLIAGVSGLIGWSLAEQLLARGCEVFGLSRGGAVPAGVQLLSCDLAADSLDASALPGDIDCVFYMAQSSRFREFPAGAGDVFRVNVDAPLRLIEWARACGVKRYVYASTGGVYARSVAPVCEDSGIALRANGDFYVASKISAEAMLGCYRRQVETTMLRYFFVYGPRQRASMLIPRLVGSVAQGVPLRLAGSEGMRLNPIYVDDAAAATIACAQAPACDVVNVAGSEVVHLRDLGLMIGSIVGIDPLFVVNEEAPSDLIANTSLMQSLYSGPYVGLRDGLSRLIAASGQKRDT